MIGAVHACIGAGVGSFFRRKSSAFLAGVVSHLIADALPHKDLPPAVEVPLMAGALAVIGARHGVDSPQFWGAIGGIAPDTEHGLAIAGVINEEQKVFPTHVSGGKFHARQSDERWSQLLLAGLSLATAALKSQKPR